MANKQLVYFYAPSWDYPPDGPIKLGNVITSVKKPHRPLFCNPPPEDSGIFKTDKSKVQYTKEKLRTGKFSILTKFLSVLGFGVDIGADVDNSDAETFVFETLETAQFTPTSSYVQKSIEASNVRQFLELSRYRKPVYIITGIKVVKGGQAITTKSRSRGAKLGVEVDGTIWTGGAVPVDGGPGVEGTVGNKYNSKWEGGSDFVFAFRVSKVWISDKKNQVVNEDEYLKGAMLGNDTKKVQEPALSVSKVEETDPQAEGFDEEELMDDEEVVVCGVPREQDSD
ncbi:hypothetical protein Golomagni_06453 [Golovinomyces magnicellulatus]|nr:hypothetical protein Golomagni_06453 [Golovinomyces magnicellulatus]